MLIEAAKLDLQSMKIGFIGAGDISQALAKSLLQHDSKHGIDGSNLYVTETIKESAKIVHAVNYKSWKILGATWAKSHRDLVVKSDIIVLAVHQKDFIMEIVSKAMHEKEDQDIEQTNKLFISIIRGMKLGYLIKHLQSITSKLTVARAMTNPFVAKGAGFSVFAMGPFNREPVLDDSIIVEAFLSYGGNCKQVPESDIDVCAGFIESAPSIVFAIMEAIRHGGITVGLHSHLATKLAAQIICGTTGMVMAGLLGDENDLPTTSNKPEIQNVVELKNATCPPKGATIASLDVLEKGSVRTAFISAVEGVAKEDKEM